MGDAMASQEDGRIPFKKGTTNVDPSIGNGMKWPQHGKCGLRGWDKMKRSRESTGTMSQETTGTVPWLDGEQITLQ
jgi:hypothetical protein